MLPSLIKSGPEEENINNFQEALNHLGILFRRFYQHYSPFNLNFY